MKSFEAFAAWRRTAFNLAPADDAEYVDALAVSHDYFTVFGGRPLYGRTFEPPGRRAERARRGDPRSRALAADVRGEARRSSATA